MTKDQVRQEIANAVMPAFHKWMAGQTVGSNKDGSTNYYECDVEDFIQSLSHLVTKQLHRFPVRD